MSIHYHLCLRIIKPAGVERLGILTRRNYIVDLIRYITHMCDLTHQKKRSTGFYTELSRISAVGGAAVTGLGWQDHPWLTEEV